MVLIEWYENAARKDFTVSERVAILDDIEKRRIGHRISKKKVANLATFQKEFKGKPSPDIAAGITHTSPAQLKKEKKLVQVVKQNPEKYGPILKKVDANKMEVNQAINYINIENVRQKLIEEAAASTIKLPDNGIELICGDFRDILADPKYHNSVPMIYTDPLYKEEALPLYEDLGKHAVSILPPGGCLVAYAGNFYKDVIFGYLSQFKPELNWWWGYCMVHTGHTKKVHVRNIASGWKELLCYIKGEKPQTQPPVMNDIIYSSPPDKVAHPYQQSTVEAEYMISNLTVEGQLVLDPFMGSGTTAIAAHKLNRKFIGIEIDKDRFEIAKANITTHLQNKGVS
jgi:predicted methyltransferase